MGDIQNTKYYNLVRANGFKPALPPQSEETLYPVNPPDSGGGQNPTNVSYLTLVDTNDTSYTDKKDFVPHVNDSEDGLVLRRINKNVDGGFANSIYLEVQEINGGSSII